MKAGSIIIIAILIFGAGVYTGIVLLRPDRTTNTETKIETVTVRDTVLVYKPGLIKANQKGEENGLQREKGKGRQEKREVVYTTLYDTLKVYVYPKGMFNIYKSWPLSYKDHKTSLNCNVTLCGAIGVYSSQEDSLWIDPELSVGINDVSFNYAPRIVKEEVCAPFRVYGLIGGYWSSSGSFVPEIGGDVELKERYLAGIGYARDGGNDHYNIHIGARLWQW